MNRATRIAPGPRTRRIIQAEIRAMSVECERVGGINLAQGVCDTALPALVAEAACRAIQDGTNSYTRHDGIAALRRAISHKLATYNHVTYDPESEVVVSAGATGALYCACMAMLEPGDEVVLFEPYYGYHVNTLLAVGAVPVYVSLHPPDWRFDRAALDAVITPRTRAILVNTPCNPSGKVFSREELSVIASVAREHDLLVLTDEIYEYFIYDGTEHVSPASLPGMRERTITISGYSKTFSITGWRVGYLACPAEWAQVIGFVNDLIYVCAPAPLQVAVARGISELTTDYYQRLSAEYKGKRDRICTALARVGLTPHIPPGAYYVLADSNSLPGGSAKERAMHLLRETGVATVPGDSFYHSRTGDNLLRVCFAKSDADLDAAIHRLDRLAR